MILHKEYDFDAIVIGAGPAGTTAATVLAQDNRNVLLIEKEKFPRYHIGESLLPFCYFTMERIGILDKVREKAYTKKYSVQFVNTKGEQSQPFYFHEHLDHEASQTWQVTRSDFDMLMLDHAREHGVTVMEETAAKSLLIDASDTVEGISVKTKEGDIREFRAPITIDASGRNNFSISQQNWRVKDPYLNKMAVWTYYKGAMRDEGFDEGATTVAFVPEKGWFWYIPLKDDMVSVGVVAERSYLHRNGRDPKAIFDAEIENNLWIKEHLSAGEQVGEYWATGEYSYRSEFCARDGLLLTGDAFAFLDPVFSSGVYLALVGGEMAGRAASEAITSGDVSAEQFAPYGEKLCLKIEAMRKLVYAFYSQNFTFRDVVQKDPSLHADLTDLLIGNTDKDFTRLFDAVSEFVDLPDPLAYGRPLTPTTAA